MLAAVPRPCAGRPEGPLHPREDWVTRPAGRTRAERGPIAHLDAEFPAPDRATAPGSGPDRFLMSEGGRGTPAKDSFDDHARVGRPNVRRPGQLQPVPECSRRGGKRDLASLGLPDVQLLRAGRYQSLERHPKSERKDVSWSQASTPRRIEHPWTRRFSPTPPILRLPSSRELAKPRHASRLAALPFSTLR